MKGLGTHLIGTAFVAAAASGGAQKVSPRAAAQDTVKCYLEGSNNHPADLLQQPDGTYIDYIGGGVKVTCPARHYVLTSDSAENHEAQHLYYFIGHVHYSEPRVKLTSDFLTYWQIGDSVHAVSNVHAIQPDGSTLDGPVVYYYHESPGVRTRNQVMALNGPTMKLAQHDSAGRPDSAITVNASHSLFMDGDSLLYASQQVVIVRGNMVSHSDSAFLDRRSGVEVTHLIGKPVINGLGPADTAKGKTKTPGTTAKDQARPFELKGTLIDAFFPNNKVNRIIARGGATATSEELSLVGDTIDIRITNGHISRAIARLGAVATNQDSVRGTMQLVADTIDLRVNNDLLERAIAWNKTKQAKVISFSQTMTADSIDVFMPNQQVRRLDAVRNAYAFAATDSTKMKATEPDQMWGDKIIAYFDSIPPRDTSKKTTLREIVATADTALWTKKDSLRARALYHLTTNDTLDRRAAISYDRAKRGITIDFVHQQVSLVTMSGGVTGIYIVPLDTVKAKADSTSKAPGKKPPGPPGTPGPPLPAVSPIKPPTQ